MIHNRFLYSLTVLPLLLCLLMTSACREDHDDLFTTALVGINHRDTVQIEHVQATITLLNLNTNQTVTSAAFTGRTVTLSLLRGSYLINVEGIMTYHDQYAAQHVRKFRSHSDFVPFVDAESNEAWLDIIFME